MTAACALVALEDWEEKLSHDNSNALFLATELNEKVDGVSVGLYPKTNMFLFEMDKKVTTGDKQLDHIGLSTRLREEFNILTFPTFNNDGIRIVTHRDVTTKDMEVTRDSIQKIVKEYF